MKVDVMLRYGVAVDDVESVKIAIKKAIDLLFRRMMELVEEEGDLEELFSIRAVKIESIDAEICIWCGRSVKIGTGRFVNRVAVLDDFLENKLKGELYPHGEWHCPECEACAYKEDGCMDGKDCKRCEL